MSVVQGSQFVVFCYNRLSKPIHRASLFMKKLALSVNSKDSYSAYDLPGIVLSTLFITHVFLLGIPCTGAHSTPVLQMRLQSQHVADINPGI